MNRLRQRGPLLPAGFFVRVGRWSKNLIVNSLSPLPSPYTIDKHLLSHSILLHEKQLNWFTPYLGILHKCIVKGDGKYANIAAASILAKTYRDEYMNKLHDEYPMYGWKKNKGYGTLIHRNAIEQYGLTPYHRISFNILPKEVIGD